MNIDNRQFLSINQLADTYLQGTQKVQSASENNNVSFEKILEDISFLCRMIIIRGYFALFRPVGR